MKHFPKLLSSQIALRHRAGDARRLQPPLPAVPRGQRRGASSASRRPTGTASSARSASASSSTTCASTRRRARCSASSSRRRSPMDVWQQVKLHYIGLLIDHHQPECAETFFNSVTTKILHRTLLPQRLHLRAAGGLHRVHRERRAGGAADLPRLLPDPRRRCARRWQRIVNNFQLEREFEDLGARRRLRAAGGRRRARRSSGCAPTSRSRCCRRCSSATRARTSSARSSTASTRCRSRCRSCTASSGLLVIDAALFGEDDLQLLFSFARAYFMVDMEVPSAYVQFLRSLMPRKPRSEIYSALGLQKQGKNLFYRDFLYHLRHSSDNFRIAPGIKGMVMLVFDLPCFPVRLQGHQGLLSRRRRTPRASRSRASTCW